MELRPGGILVQTTMRCRFCGMQRVEAYAGYYGDQTPRVGRGDWRLVDGDLVCPAHTIEVDGDSNWWNVRKDEEAS